MINDLPFLQLSAIFDPGFQINNKSITTDTPVSSSLENILSVSDAIIFSESDRNYYQFIEKVIKNGKSVFLNAANNLSINEHKHLISLCEESKEIIQVQHPYFLKSLLNNKEYDRNFLQIFDSKISGIKLSEIMYKMRCDISCCLGLITSNIKHLSVKTYSLFSDFPDTCCIQLDFDNGTIARLLVEGHNHEKEHKISLLGYNRKDNFNLITNKHSVYFKNNNVDKKFLQHISIKAQLTDFYAHLMHNTLPLHGIENEFRTQQIIEKVKEKIHLAANVF